MMCYVMCYMMCYMMHYMMCYMMHYMMCYMMCYMIRGTTTLVCKPCNQWWRRSDVFMGPWSYLSMRAL